MQLPAGNIVLRARAIKGVHQMEEEKRSNTVNVELWMNVEPGQEKKILNVFPDVVHNAFKDPSGNDFVFVKLKDVELVTVPHRDEMFVYQVPRLKIDGYIAQVIHYAGSNGKLCVRLHSVELDDKADLDKVENPYG